MSVLPVLVQFLKRRRLIPSPMMANVTKVTVTTMMVILQTVRELVFFSHFSAFFSHPHMGPHGALRTKAIKGLYLEPKYFLLRPYKSLQPIHFVNFFQDNPIRPNNNQLD